MASWWARNANGTLSGTANPGSQGNSGTNGESGVIDQWIAPGGPILSGAKMQSGLEHGAQGHHAKGTLSGKPLRQQPLMKMTMTWMDVQFMKLRMS